MSRHLRDMRERLADESGVALVVAILVSILMLAMSLALLAFTDRQVRLTGDERVRESSLNLAEAAMNAQANLLTSAWPETPDKAFVPCTQSSNSVACPNPARLLSGFTNKDYASGGAPSWNLSVRDNALGGYYDDVATASQPAWDANGPTNAGPDGLMWLRAQATVRGKTKTLVTLIRATPISLAFPRGVVTAGHFHTGNNGNKQLVDASGPGIFARCTVGPGGPARGNACLDYPPARGQVFPNSYTSDPTIPDAMSQADIDSLRNRAKAANRYYATCPSPIPSAQLVFVENGPCSISSGTIVNSKNNPGLLVINTGTLTMSGGGAFYGLIYAVNSNDSTGIIVNISGNATVAGAIVVDGPGGVSVTGSSIVLSYDANVFNLVTTTQQINVIANSWRELKGSG